LRKAVYGGNPGRRARFSHIAKIQERKNRGIMIKKIALLFLLILNKWSTNGTVTVPVAKPEVTILRIPVLGPESKFCKVTDEIW
jgi:hypothetical protein